MRLGAALLSLNRTVHICVMERPRPPFWTVVVYSNRGERIRTSGLLLPKQAL